MLSVKGHLATQNNLWHSGQKCIHPGRLIVYLKFLSILLSDGQIVISFGRLTCAPFGRQRVTI